MNAGMRRRYHREAVEAMGPDRCETVMVDGEPVSVRTDGSWTDEDRAFFAEVIRAAKRRARGEA